MLQGSCQPSSCSLSVLPSLTLGAEHTSRSFSKREARVSLSRGKSASDQGKGQGVGSLGGEAGAEAAGVAGVLRWSLVLRGPAPPSPVTLGSRKLGPLRGGCLNGVPR